MSAVARPRRFWFALTLLLSAVLGSHESPIGAQGLQQRWDGVIEHVSVASGSGWPYPAGATSLSRHPASEDGRFIVFNAVVPNAPYPTTTQIFMRDRLNSEPQMVIGMQPVHPPVISGNGRYMAFDSCEIWFRNDYQPICDVYIVDLQQWRIVNASTALDGTLSSAASSEPVLSRDGRFLVFRTDSPTLLPPGAAPGQLVMRDRDPDGNGIFDEEGQVTLEVISVAANGEIGNDESASPEVSADGGVVAFRSRASNLVSGDTNNAWDVFYRDRFSNETRRINVSSTGQEATPTTDSPAISIDEYGYFIAFAADDGYLGDPPTYGADFNNALDVMIYDRLANQLSRLDFGATNPVGDGPSWWPTLSADGRYVSLLSLATNVIDAPTTPGRAHVYVVDRWTGGATRITKMPDGQDPDADATTPAISGDGTVVLFASAATNLVTTATSGVDSVFAAAYFDAGPSALTIPARGGDVEITVSAQRHVGWFAQMEPYSWWLNWATPPWGVGDGTIRVSALENNDLVPRVQTVVVNGKTITVTQEAGISLTSSSPAAGTVGTVVTLTGTAFEPGMRVYFDGIEVPAEYVDSTTIRAVAPPHDAGDIYVWARTYDFRWAIPPQPFHYRDTTPPQIYPWVDGVVTASGWYTSDVYVAFAVFDPDSSLISSTGCQPTTLTTDTGGTTFTCTATSEGGTSSASTVTIRRDTRPPFAGVTTPEPTLYKRNQVVNANFFCGDATSGTASGIASCSGSAPNGTPIDTSTSGYHVFTATAMDNAGLASMTTRSYAVSTGMCTVRPTGLVAWWPADNHYRDVIGNANGTLVNGSFGGDFAQGISRQAMSFVLDSKYVRVPESPALQMTGAFTLSAWIYSASSTFGVIAGREGEYLLARDGNGHIVYSVANSNPGWGWVDTGIAIPFWVYSHVALTYDGAAIRLYVNGVLVYMTNASGAIGDVAPTLNEFRIAARQEPGNLSKYGGLIDNVELVGRALADNEIEQAFLSADVGYCPDPTSLTFVPSPPHGTYNTATSPLVVRLTRNGVPEPNTAVSFVFRGTSYGSVTTDANGLAQVTLPFPNGWAAGTYANAATASVAGSALLAATTTTADFIVDQAPLVITWATPSPVVHGTALSSAQLNASSNFGGSFSYTPSFNAVLPAGTHTLSVTVTPGNPNFAVTSASVSLQVNKATPTVQVTGGTFVYDGATHAATGAVKGLGGASIATPTFTYNGSANLPTEAGTYSVVASFAGDSNYLPASANATLTITKATPSVSAASATVVYDGAAHTLAGSVTGVGGVDLGSPAFTYNGAMDAPVNAGSYAVIASFAGNANYVAASANATLTITRAAATVTVADAAFTFDAAPHGATGSVTGLGGVPLGSPTFTYNGSATVPVSGGSYAVVASYAGNTNYAPASATATLVIGKATPVVTVSGGNFTYDGAAHAATGSVTGIGGASLGSPSYTYNGSSTAPANAGAYDVVATFAGDQNYTSTSASATITINKAVASLAWPAPGSIGYGTPLGATQLNASSTVAGSFAYAPAAGTVLAAGSNQPLSATFTPADPANYVGGSVATTITVAPAPLVVLALNASKPFGAPLPAFSGSATGFVNGDTLASLGGSLSFVTTATAGSAVGTYPIVPSGLSSPNYAIAFVAGTLSIVKGAVSVSVATSPEPSGSNQAMTFTATVGAAAPAAGRPNGTVRFFDGSTLLGSATLNAGTASLATAGLPSGTHQIEARYDGDVSFLTGTATSPHEIRSANDTPMLTLASSRNPAAQGQAVTLTATVAMASGSVSGNVEFYSGTTLLGTAPIVTGKAKLTSSSLPLGGHAIVARYVGSATAPPAWSPVFAQTIDLSNWKDRATTMTIASSANPATLGATPVVTVTITGSNSVKPTGRVLVMVNGAAVGDPAGIAVTPLSGSSSQIAVSVPNLAHGVHSVSATYLADATYKANTVALSQTVN